MHSPPANHPMRHLLAALLIPMAAEAQSHAAWRVRTDNPADTIAWTQMPPGWHITTGPGALIYDAANVASGRFAVSMEVHLFPKASEEGYGVFVGGRALEGSAPSYVAFLMRRDGAFQVQRVDAGARTPIVDWMQTTSIKPHSGGDDTALNVLSVRADADSLRIDANGKRVTAIPRRDLSLDGAFGFRVGAGVNLHVTNLDVTHRLAPAPRPRS